MRQSSFKRARLEEFSPRRAAFRRLLTDKAVRTGDNHVSSKEFPECEFQSASQIFEIGLAMAWLSAGSSKAQELCPSITLLRHRSHATKAK
jgi:hypothetical protein